MNAFTKKYGKLLGWQWVALGVGGLLLLAYGRQYMTKSTSSSSSSSDLTSQELQTAQSFANSTIAAAQLATQARGSAAPAESELSKSLAAYLTSSIQNPQTMQEIPGYTAEAQYAQVPGVSAPAAAPQVAAWDPNGLAELWSGSFPLAVAQSEIQQTGTLTGSGGWYTGHNVAKGAPVYWRVDTGGGNYQWVQNQDPNVLPVGTQYGTLKSLASYINPVEQTGDY